MLTFFRESHIFSPVMVFPKVTKRDAGYYLRVWRAERNLTQTEAGVCFGIGPAQLSLIENGARNASPATAAKMAEATGQPIQVFLGIAVPK